MKLIKSSVSRYPMRGLVAGAAAGLIAAAAMNAVQAAAMGLSDRFAGSGEPATVKTADSVIIAVSGKPIPDHRRELAGETVHYALGAVLGAAYGLAAEYRRGVTVGFGTAFGALVALLLDEAIVPALGLGDAPWETRSEIHAYGMGSHVVFGATLEACRRAFGGNVCE